MLHIATIAELEAVIDDALRRSDGDLARQALREHGDGLAMEDGTSFRALIGKLPTALWESDPLILAMVGVSFRSGSAPGAMAALSYFDAAQQILASDDSWPVTARAHVNLRHVAALRAVGHLEKAWSVLDSTGRLLDQERVPSVTSRMQLVARAALAGGMLRIVTGSFDGARTDLALSLSLSEHLAVAERIECLGALAVIDYSAGLAEDAMEQCRAARRLAEGTRLLDTGFASLGLCTEAMIHSERGELDRAKQLTADAHRSAGNSEWLPFPLIVEAQTLSIEGRAAEALDALQRAERHHAGDPETSFVHGVAHLVRAAILIAVDHGDEARRILERLPDHEHHLLCPGRYLAQLSLLHGDLAGADAALSRCESLGDTHSGRSLIDVQLLRAAVERQRERHWVADLAFDRALLRMGVAGTRMPVRILPVELAEALLQRAATRPQPPSVRAILERAGSDAVGVHWQVVPLSERERDVLLQVAQGLTVDGIARALYLSPNTVKSHLRRLYRKLGVSNRAEAIRRAHALGINPRVTRSSPDDGEADDTAPVM